MTLLTDIIHRRLPTDLGHAHAKALRGRTLGLPTILFLLHHSATNCINDFIVCCIFPKQCVERILRLRVQTITKPSVGGDANAVTLAT